MRLIEKRPIRKCECCNSNTPNDGENCIWCSKGASTRAATGRELTPGRFEPRRFGGTTEG